MKVKNISANELREKLKNNKDGLEMIDVRGEDEYGIINIAGSKLIPLNDIQEKLSEIDFSKQVVFVCRSGARSDVAANLASANTGKEVYNLTGGIGALYGKGEEYLEINDPEMLIHYF